MEHQEPKTTRVSVRRKSGLAWDQATFTISDDELYRFAGFMRGIPGVMEVGPEKLVTKSSRTPEDQRAIEAMGGI